MMRNSKTSLSIATSDIVGELVEDLKKKKTREVRTFSFYFSYCTARRRRSRREPFFKEERAFVRSLIGSNKIYDTIQCAQFFLLLFFTLFSLK
jgi:hypothetical protein